MKWEVTDKGLNEIVAAKAHESGRLHALAAEAAAAIIAQAAIHNKTGAYIGKIRIIPHKVDVYVEATDPAAGHIEWGHKLSGKPNRWLAGQVPGGKDVGGKPEHWVHGLHIVRNAVLAMGGHVGK